MAEINQCYYSEENVCDDTDDPVNLTNLAISTLAARNYTRNLSVSDTMDTKIKLKKLSISVIDNYNVDSTIGIDNNGDIKSIDDNNCDKLNFGPNMCSLRNKKLSTPLTTPQISGDSTASSDKTIFNVARVKRVDLQNLSLIKGLEGNSDFNNGKSVDCC